MSRSLDVLQPDFRKTLEQVIDQATKAGYMMVPYETQRDVWDQAKYWRRSRPRSHINEMCHKLRSLNAPFLASVIEEVGPQNGRWATNAIPGLSWHQWGLAADLYWDSNGDKPGGIEWNNLEGYAAFAKIARDAGLTSGFFWKSRDAVHVQLPTDSKPFFKLEDISKLMEIRYRG